MPEALCEKQHQLKLAGPGGGGGRGGEGGGSQQFLVLIAFSVQLYSVGLEKLLKGCNPNNFTAPVQNELVGNNL